MVFAALKKISGKTLLVIPLERGDLILNIHLLTSQSYSTIFQVMCTSTNSYKAMEIKGHLPYTLYNNFISGCTHR